MVVVRLARRSECHREPLERLLAAMLCSDRIGLRGEAFVIWERRSELDDGDGGPPGARYEGRVPSDSQLG